MPILFIVLFTLPVWSGEKVKSAPKPPQCSKLNVTEIPSYPNAVVKTKFFVDKRELEIILFWKEEYEDGSPGWSATGMLDGMIFEKQDKGWKCIKTVPETHCPAMTMGFTKSSLKYIGPQRPALFIDDGESRQD